MSTTISPPPPAAVPAASSSSLTAAQSISDGEVEIDVIVPVHNAVATLRESVTSALFQVGLQDNDRDRFRICVCCYDDGSTDQSWELLTQLAQEHKTRQNDPATAVVCGKTGKPYLKTTLRIARAVDGVSRGAGYARNRAADMREKEESLSDSKSEGTSRTISKLLAMLDSDDVMRPTRLAEQAYCLSSINETQLRQRTLVGCKITRDPPQSTWHYTEWANGLSDERLVLEKFREVTLLQPTWMMYRSWFHELGGYLEAPPPQPLSDGRFDMAQFAGSLTGTKTCDPNLFQLIDSSSETPQSLRVAEDTRFFYKHLYAGGQLRLLRTEQPLLVYRHREGQSQSSQTSRKLLLRLRVRAFEHMVLENESYGTTWSKFCVWGAGRDGKDFVKALRPELRRRVFCMVDVDEKKISLKHYVNKELNLRIPILHFSMLAREAHVREELRALFESGADSQQPGFGRIRKSQDKVDKGEGVVRPAKRRKVSHVDIDESILPQLPVVVCVAMYRTGGALEFNVNSIGRTEGADLWHFS